MEKIKDPLKIEVQFSCKRNISTLLGFSSHVKRGKFELHIKIFLLVGRTELKNEKLTIVKDFDCS